MPANRGVVFSLEAALATIVFIVVLISLLYSPKVTDFSFKSQQQMTVAHDLVVANSNDPPAGYDVGTSCSSSDSVSKLVVSPYENWHAEVCMR